MSNRKQRDKNRANALALHYSLPPKTQCPNCKEFTHQGHFMVLFLGESGYYVCQEKTE